MSRAIPGDPLAVSALIVAVGFLIFHSAPADEADGAPAPPAAALVWGDVTGDSNVTSLDADTLSEYVAGTRNATTLDLRVADVNQDGRITGADSLWISQYAAGTRSHLGPGA